MKGARASWVVLVPLFALSPMAWGETAQSQAKGFLEDGTWSVLNRSVFDQRDYRHGGRNSGARNAYKPRGARNGQAEE